MGTAVNLITGFHAMPDDRTIAVTAPGCQHTDGAFKTVKRITSSCHLHPERLVVLIAAFVAFCHSETFPDAPQKLFPRMPIG
jgi:hypothetical protein